MDQLDMLIETAAIEGQMDAGMNPALVAARSTLGKRVAIVLKGKNCESGKAAKSPTWSEREDAFLKEYHGIISEEDIAEALGRTVVAVHLRVKRDLQLPAQSRKPDILTANQVALGLCLDIHSVMRLLDRGIIEGYRLPSARNMRVVSRTTLLRFLIKSENWIYFKTSKINLKIYNNGRGGRVLRPCLLV